MAIATLAGMKSYILSVLGDPVIQVELADAQLNRIIDDSIQIVQKYNTGTGNYFDLLAFTVSAGVSAYDASSMNLASIIDLELSYVDNNGINTLFSAQHQLLWRDWVIHGNYPGGSGGYSSEYSGMVLVGYEIAMQYLNDVNDMFTRYQHAQYNDQSKMITIYPTPDITGIVLLKVYKKETALNLYNDNLMKEYSVAEAKIQWGNNLNKYNMTLPDGGTINGADILAQGKEEKEKILEQISGESEPPMFFMA